LLSIAGRSGASAVGVVIVPMDVVSWALDYSIVPASFTVIASFLPPRTLLVFIVCHAYLHFDFRVFNAKHYGNFGSA
tara:strand:- start:5106 stop:5336 length:231 start_codon:yes stop_codon:yes gene_type:complete